MTTARASRSRFSAAEDVLRSVIGIRCTAAVLRVECGGRLAFERAYGAVDDSHDAWRINPATPFDLASLTKVFVATLALRAVAEKRLTLDGSLVDVLPEWRGTEHAEITLRRLLAHNAGMQSGADYRELLGDDVEQYALRRPLVAPVAERVIYSDLGFIALGTILQRVCGTSLAAEMRRMTAALDAPDALFRPPAWIVAKIPATEDDGWRGRLQGVVHDEKAYLRGGVAGHAGLFGVARDCARVADMYLAACTGRASSPIVPDTLAREATREAAHDTILRRGLGWALKTTDENSCGRLMGPRTFGHTGFTGTCMWSDPDRDLTIVLLTNAVYYGRSDIRDLRAAVCDAVVEAVDA